MVNILMDFINKMKKTDLNKLNEQKSLDILSRRLKKVEEQLKEWGFNPKELLSLNVENKDGKLNFFIKDKNGITKDIDTKEIINMFKPKLENKNKNLEIEDGRPELGKKRKNLIE